MTRQANNIVSFDEARRAVSARRPVASNAPRSAIYDQRAYREDLRRSRAAQSMNSSRVAGASAANRANEAHEEDADRSFEAFFGKIRERASKAKREATKAKADREFTKHYAADHASQPSDSGPRAAVYRGEMGTQHKRASRMQNESGASGVGASFALPSINISGIMKKPVMFGGVAIMACLLACCVFLYAPAQQYYQELRDRDRLAVEYQLVSERNEAIASEVALLSTPEGIQDRAREEFGWISEGEYAVSVVGVSSADKMAGFQANINAASVKAPETWYSDFLDSFFGYER
ncbi:MAG: septum formation initiator family protein [Eggerthellaceae bacterium]|nr:septum formation initiator family protein [Eggerthellaceae bacterium]